MQIIIASLEKEGINNFLNLKIAVSNLVGRWKTRALISPISVSFFNVALRTVSVAAYNFETVRTNTNTIIFIFTTPGTLN